MIPAAVALAVVGTIHAQLLTGRSHLRNANGDGVCHAALEEASGGVLIQIDIVGLPPGIHALHIHDTGKCEAPDFTLAGGHLNPGNKNHGLRDEKGLHAGDLPNFEIGEDGKAIVEVFSSRVTLQRSKKHSLLKPGGTALVVHAGADDHETDPAGDAGPRIACGVTK